LGATPTKPVSGPKPDFVSPQLAAAMSHPTRVHAMSILGERAASPRELAEEMDEPLNNVTYHVNQLRDLGCIELVRTEPRAGGRVLERFYQTTQRAYFDDDAWAELSQKERLGVNSTIIKMMAKDLAVAMAGGTFFADDDKHLSRWPIQVDETGWGEIREALTRAGRELFEIEGRVAQRREAGEETSINVKVNLMQYRSPSPDGEPPADA
jgi:DNA-binding transcriptional ArsR family regulator